jgi:arylsulfatase
MTKELDEGFGRRRFLGASAVAAAATAAAAAGCAPDNKPTGSAPAGTGGAAVPDDGSVLPMPSKPFDGKIGDTYADSTPGEAYTLTAPEGAPNVVVVLLDDVGFGHTSPFGGPVNTPTLQRLAKEGLRYNRFHTTALCSPTRAALLTGRNHHSAHTGTIMELATGYPGYDGVIRGDTATVAQTLRLRGYNTAAYGKWHNTPDYELSSAGPFDRWPTSLGFDEFYGFQGGEANQWHTPLYHGTTPIEPPDEPGWHFSEAIADKCIDWITGQKAVNPNKPFFVYWAPGAAHAPHQVAAEWADKYKGKFDHGWDEQRRLTWEGQKKLGVIPADTKLTPRPDSIPAWDKLPPGEKRLYARMQEVYAGFLEHADAQAGRILDRLEELGIRDNTLFIYIVGDNGPSAEGSLTGTLNNMKSQQGFPDDPQYMLSRINEIGGPLHENHYPVGWCWAGSSPFQWMKQVASHFGGTRNPMVISWPARIKDPGGMRSQFHHVIDIAPTILDVANIAQPVSVNGNAQKPIEGISLAYTFDDASAPGQRSTQYFEMLGNRAIYHDGWVAGCRHGKLPWQTVGSASFDNDTWELYNIDVDFSQANDLAKDNADRLSDMQDMFTAEAKKYNVLPLDDRFAERADASLRPNPLAGKKTFVYLPGTVRIPEPVAPNTKNVDHTIAAEVEIPPGGAKGALVSMGGESAGYTLFVHDGKLVWEHNWFNDIRYRVTSDEVIPPGRHVLSAEIRVDDKTKPGTGGNVILRSGEKVIGKGRFDKQVPYRYTVNETFDIGCSLVTPVSNLYESPATFTGKVDKVIIDISGESLDDLAMREKIALGTQ